jgi:DNA repair photolyase
MITTKSIIDLIEVMHNDVIRVRVKTSVLSDDAQIAESFEHRVIAPGADYSTENAKVQTICAAVHTADGVAAYQAEQARIVAEQAAQ